MKNPFDEQAKVFKDEMNIWEGKKKKAAIIFLIVIIILMLI